MVFYYIIAVILNIVSIILFFSNINITVFSVIPVAVMAIMAFQAFYFKSESKEKPEMSTAYSADNVYTEAEEKSLLQYVATVLLIAIPLFVLFALFFNNIVKIFSIFLYMICLALGGIIYRVKNKGSINSRVNAEKKELEEQRKNESLGKFR